MRTDLQFTCIPPYGWLFISGELDLSTHNRLRDAFECLRLRGCTELELNLEGIQHIDAHTLGLIYQEQRRMIDLGGGLSVSRGSSTYRLVSRMAGYRSLQPPPQSAATPA
jgi:anti-anti-sigma factor